MPSLKAFRRLSVPKVMLGTFLLALLFFVLLQISMRYVRVLYFSGVEEASLLCATYLYFLGMSYVTYTDSHIRCDILRSVVKNPLVSKYITLVSLCICLFVAIASSYLAFDHSWYVAVNKQVTIALRAPRIIFMASVVIGFFLTSAFLLFRIVTEIRTPTIERREDKA